MIAMGTDWRGLRGMDVMNTGRVVCMDAPINLFLRTATRHKMPQECCDKIDGNFLVITAGYSA